jgi:hypothetical protein
MNAADILSVFVRTSVAPLLKAAGFKKTALTWHRRKDRAVHVINIQKSSGNSAEQMSFYVNVGVALDELCRHMDISVSEKPKEYECDALGVRHRIDRFVPGAPPCWDIGKTVPDFIDLLDALQSVVAQMDAITDAATFAETSWLHESHAKSQILYVLGRDQESLDEVTRHAARFHDRMNSDVNSLIERLRLPRLLTRR